MITLTKIYNTFRLHSCDNCNREMPLILKYEFIDNSVKLPYLKLHLCEDCSNAISNLHHKVMENGKIHKYDLDEISEVK